MHLALASYRKTLVLAAAGAAVVSAATVWLAAVGPGRIPAGLQAGALLLLALALLVLVATVLCGLLVLYRERLHARGEADLFERLNAPRSLRRLEAVPMDQPGVLPLRSLRRLLGGPAMLVGDRVRVRPLGEILATLDGTGCLDGLPFMPEMARFCGRDARVFRCIDKIYDYGGRKDMRRMRDCVSLTMPRCDGSGHDGCQAGCTFFWKSAWLEPAGAGIPAPARDGHGWTGDANETLARHARREDGAGYACQFTALVGATTTMSAADPRQDIRPLVAGNVTLAAFLVAIATRHFNRVQGLRGGIGYLTIRPSAGNTSPRVDLGLDVGQAVRIRGRDEIAATLDRHGRNRGLWFDRDMLKHCGRAYRVDRVIERIIDDATGRMLQMKTPCLALSGLNASGEFMRFCPQEDYPFWREAWLEPAPDLPRDAGRQERDH